MMIRLELKANVSAKVHYVDENFQVFKFPGFLRLLSRTN